MPFCHLHTHTQYSVLDGAIKIKDLIATVKSLGQESVAVTDHGVMHSVVDFYEEAKNNGIRPIVGCEVYITAGSRFDRRPVKQGGAETHHLTLLVQNKKGFENLSRLSSLGYLEGFYHKPRIDFDLLKEHSAGLICLSGCLASEFAAYASEGQEDRAREIIERYAQVFGDRFFLEVQPHDLKEQRMLNAVARELGKSCGIPLVATNDAHYLYRDDLRAHEVLLCVSTGKLLTDKDRMQHPGCDLYLKTEEEMLRELPDFADAVECSGEIAKRCELEFNFNTHYMPQFDIEAAPDDYFAQQAREGLTQRFKEYALSGRKFSPEQVTGYDERLEEEIKLILQMGFEGYFLVVADFIGWAKSNQIAVGPGRGSAAGSLVAYALGITDVDPIEHKLLFERFLNPERISLPDIDIDFCVNGRDRVIEYVRERYGREKVAQIVTFGTLKAKAVIKDVGRVLGLSFAETDRIAKLIPAPRQGFDFSIAEALQMEKRLKEFSEGEGAELIQLAMKLEGLSRHTSTHAAGIVIADRPVMELLPLMTDKEGQVITQLAMGAVEKLGLVKFDFLGLKTLTVLDQACRLISLSGAVPPKLSALPLNDEQTYRLISAGKTTGIFQLESSGITDMVIRLRPNCFEDIVAILALYRPGPLDAGMADHFINRKHGREPVKYLHPLLETILKDTYGIILYQEQIMQIARDLAGYSLGDADLLRRAMGKKKPAEMAKQRKRFIAGATAKGLTEALAVEIFDQMETFARYGFNRSHSVAYALISYQTAYLKAHYPRQFLAALMTFEMRDSDKTLKNLNECRELGISILPPDVNRGLVGFSVDRESILFGLGAISGIGEKGVEQIIDERNRGGNFVSLLDFCCRVDLSAVNHRTIENLIKSGAFDWTGTTRAQLFAELDECMSTGARWKADRDSNQISLFGNALGKVSKPTQLARMERKIPEWPSQTRLSYEREALGFYLSGHPLERFRPELRRLGSMSIETLETQIDGVQVLVAGVINFLKLKNTKKGDRYATFSLEDLTSYVDVIVWPDVYQKVHALLASEDPIIVTGRLDVTDERRQIIAQDIQSAVTLRDKTAKEALVRVSLERCSNERLQKLESLLKEFKGACPVKLILVSPKQSEVVVSLPEAIKIEPSEALCNKAEELFGEPVLHFR
ncbi:DNA polymerase III subunit alpha [bacterium]|nr:DNA polymerase III subunit alpha [bacterium]